MDSGAEFAVSKINNDPSVLPDTIVNILRVQSWDWNSGPGDGVGGMAVSTLVVGEQFPGWLHLFSVFVPTYSAYRCYRKLLEILLI